MNFIFALQAAVLDRRVYQNITEDGEWFTRAISVVAVAAIAFGIGVRFVPIPGGGIQDTSGWIGSLGVHNVQMLLAISTMFMSWIMWSVIAYYVGTRLLRGRGSYKIIVRSLGIAYSPCLLLVFMGFFPSAQFQIFNIVGLWLLASGSIAIKEAQGFGWLKAAFPILFGWLVSWPFLTNSILLMLSQPTPT